MALSLLTMLSQCYYNSPESIDNCITTYYNGPNSINNHITILLQ